MENESQQQPVAAAAVEQSAAQEPATPAMYESLVAPAPEEEPEIPFLSQYQPHSFWDN
ncbi:MAG: hypothetical protein ACI4AM_02445 [Muribaculaceae bacterium]